MLGGTPPALWATSPFRGGSAYGSSFRGGSAYTAEAAPKAPLKGELSAELTEGFFVLCPRHSQHLLVAGLAAGNAVKAAAD